MRIVCGECAWSYDEAVGRATVSPLPQTRGIMGTLDGLEGGPQGDDVRRMRAEARSIVVERGCVAPRCSRRLLAGFPNVTEMNLSGLDMSGAEDMSRLFEGDAALRSLSEWRRVPATTPHSMALMFRGAGIDGYRLPPYAETEREVERRTRRDTGTTYDSRGITWRLHGYALDVMPSGGACEAELERGPLAPYEWAQVRVLTYHRGLVASGRLSDQLPRGASLTHVREVRAGGIDVSRVDDLSSAFSALPRLETIDFTGWDTSRVRDVSHMLSGCDSLRMADLSALDLSCVTRAEGMLSHCGVPELLALPESLGDGLTECRYMLHDTYPKTVACSDRLALACWEDSGAVLPGHDVDTLRAMLSDRLYDGARECAEAINAAAGARPGDHPLAAARRGTGDEPVTIEIGRPSEHAVAIRVYSEEDLERAEAAAALVAAVLSSERDLARDTELEVDYLRHNPRELGTTHSPRAHDVESPVTLTPTDTADEYPVTARDAQSATLEVNQGRARRHA